jgi:hypothetical protein
VKTSNLTQKSHVSFHTSSKMQLQSIVPFAFLIKCNISQWQQMCLESLVLMKPMVVCNTDLCLELSKWLSKLRYHICSDQRLIRCYGCCQFIDIGPARKNIWMNINSVQKCTRKTEDSPLISVACNFVLKSIMIKADSGTVIYTKIFSVIQCG